MQACSIPASEDAALLGLHRVSAPVAELVAKYLACAAHAPRKSRE